MGVFDRGYDKCNKQLHGLMTEILKSQPWESIMVCTHDDMKYSNEVEGSLKHLLEVPDEFYKGRKGCSFLSSEVRGIERNTTANRGEVKIIRTWISPSNFTKARSFHELTSASKGFVKNLSNAITSSAELKTLEEIHERQEEELLSEGDQWRIALKAKSGLHEGCMRD